MNSAIIPLRQAIYNRLTTDATLSAKITGVFDYVPETQPFPYIYIGEFTEAPNHTFTREGRIVTGALHVWSEQKSDMELLEIVDRLTTLLDHNEFAVDGWHMVISQVMSSLTVRERLRQDFDDSKRQAVVNVMFTLEKM